MMMATRPLCVLYDTIRSDTKEENSLFTKQSPLDDEAMDKIKSACCPIDVLNQFSNRVFPIALVAVPFSRVAPPADSSLSNLA